jgi:hypothetical protein
MNLREVSKVNNWHNITDAQDDEKEAPQRPKLGLVHLWQHDYRKGCEARACKDREKYISHPVGWSTREGVHDQRVCAAHYQEANATEVKPVQHRPYARAVDLK